MTGKPQLESYAIFKLDEEKKTFTNQKMKAEWRLVEKNDQLVEVKTGNRWEVVGKVPPQGIQMKFT